jgi:hypothetical protein
MKARDEAPELFLQLWITPPNSSEDIFKTQCLSNGIAYEKTVPDSPNQNGVAERMNLTLASMSHAILIDTDLTSWFWPFAIQTAIHIKNRVPHSNLLAHSTPYQLWYGEKPNLAYFCLFGTHCTSRVLSNSLTKFEPRRESGCFLGYAKDSKGYIIWVAGPNGQSGSIKIRRDVQFHALSDTVSEKTERSIDFNPFPGENDHAPLQSEGGHVDDRPYHFDFDTAYASFTLPFNLFPVTHSFMKVVFILPLWSPQIPSYL